MPLFSRIRGLLGRDRASRQMGESDAPADTSMARARPTGGAPDSEAPDTHSTTGTTSSGTFVGQATGDEAGDTQASGAERRAEHEKSHGPADPDADDRE